MLNILFLEDDPILTDIIIEFLQSKNYDVDHAYDLDEAKEFIDNNLYDILLFDVNLPDGNGFNFLMEIRQLQINTPAIFITALNSVNDMKKAFKSGCDDYIKKPFELEELEIRLSNIKRIYNLDNIINIDENITLDKEKFLIKIDTKIESLSNKEIKILEYLLINENRIVSNDELVSNIWRYDEIPSDATIRTYIKKLRSILGSDKIQTIRGVGYRFIKK